MTAKAVQNGRLAMGTAALSMASMAYLSGGLHGNGPTDRKTKTSMDGCRLETKNN